MLTTYQQNVLRTELQRSDYNGKTADQGWAWLTQPVAQSPVTTPTGVMLTPITVAGALGSPAKAEAIAAAVKTTYPTIGDHLLTAGVDPTHPETQAFLGQLVAAGTITQQDAATLAALATTTTTPPPLPPRFDARFSTTAFPHVAADGTTGGPDDPAIHGFPNYIVRADFDLAWTAAGRS